MGNDLTIEQKATINQLIPIVKSSLGEDRPVIVIGSLQINQTSPNGKISESREIPLGTARVEDTQACRLRIPFDVRKNYGFDRGSEWGVFAKDHDIILRKR